MQPELVHVVGEQVGDGHDARRHAGVGATTGILVELHVPLFFFVVDRFRLIARVQRVGGGGHQAVPREDELIASLAGLQHRGRFTAEQVARVQCVLHLADEGVVLHEGSNRRILLND